VSHSELLVTSVQGRQAFDGAGLVTIEEWAPFGVALCDVRVRSGEGRVYWTSLHTLRPKDGVPFPRRLEVSKMRDEEILVSLKKERAGLVEEIHSGRRWPGCEFGKAIIGRSIDGAIADVQRRRGEP